MFGEWEKSKSNLINSVQQEDNIQFLTQVKILHENLEIYPDWLFLFRINYLY